MNKNELANILIKYHYFPTHYNKYESIQGGKMEHLFKYSRQGKNNLYNFDYFNSELAKEAFHIGKWTVKFHGANGFITKENNEMKIWERRDLLDKPLDSLKDFEILEIDNISNNPNYKKTILPEFYESKQKKHHYIFIKVKPDSKMGKRLYPRIEFMLRNINNFCQSIEIVGQKVQGNPNHFNWNVIKDHSYGIVLHSSIETYIPDISIDKLKEIAESLKIEGWVIYHKGHAFKLRTNMITDKAAFNNKDKTDILGLVY